MRKSRLCFFFSSRRRHTRFDCDWSSDVCSSDLSGVGLRGGTLLRGHCLRSGALHLWRGLDGRSEERRVGKEWGARWGPDALQKKRRAIGWAVVLMGALAARGWWGVPLGFCLVRR